MDFLTRLIRKCGKEVILQLFESKETQTATSIYKKIDVTYTYLTTLIKEMINAGLIIRERQGREYDLFLTKKGYQVVRSLKFIEKTFGRSNGK